MSRSELRRGSLMLDSRGDLSPSFPAFSSEAWFPGTTRWLRSIGSKP
jgi:hypothetical protein